MDIGAKELVGSTLGIAVIRSLRNNRDKMSTLL